MYCAHLIIQIQMIRNYFTTCMYMYMYMTIHVHVHVCRSNTSLTVQYSIVNTVQAIYCLLLNYL